MVAYMRQWRGTILVLGILLSIYLATRLFHLTLLPIFTDEAIYIRWSQIGSRDANWRFISLTDGKQPLFTWIMMVMLRVIENPLFAGRFVSVLAGAVSMIGLWVLSFEIFKKKAISNLTCAFYILSPFALWYDRMALYDSLVATLFIWSIYLSIRLVRSLRLDCAMILGVVLGLGMLNKTSGFLSLFLIPFTLLLFDWSRKNRKTRIARWILLVLLAGGISQVLYSVLRLSPFFHMISQKDSVFVYPFTEWIKHPFLFAQGNIRGLFDWLWHYLTLPIFIASLVSIFSIGKDWRGKIVLALYWLVPFVALAFFGKVLYPRFILFMTMPLLVLAASTLYVIFKKLGTSLLALTMYAVLLGPSFYIDYYIVSNPRYAPIPYSDKGQFVDDWPAGWGVKEVNEFIYKQSTQGKVSVFTDGTFGLLPYAIEIYLVDKPNISIHGLWPIPENIPTDIVVSALDHPTFFVLNQTQVPPSGWHLELINEYQKGNRVDRKLRLYRVLNSKTTKI